MESSLDSANNNHFNPSHHDSLDIFYKSKVSYDDDGDYDYDGNGDNVNDNNDNDNDNSSSQCL